MGRKRKSNPLNLPPRVYAKNGAFYYHHPGKPARWERLGTDLEQVKRRAGAIATTQGEGYGTVAYWLDQFLAAYKRRVAAGDRAQRTLDDYTDNAVLLKAFFGAMYPHAVEPHHVGDYLDTNLEAGRGVRANREKACLSAMFTWLIRAGAGSVTRNPCLGVKRNTETKRARYVEHEELRKTLEHAPAQVRALAELVYCTLQRPEDIIGWTLRNLVERRDATGRVVKVIRNKQGKTGAEVDIEVTPDIEAILARLKVNTTAKGVVAIGRLIHRRDGKPYTYDGLAAMLKRRQAAAGVASFGYYDLKGKGATDMWLAGVPLERIQALCGHESVTTTERYVKSRWRGVVQPNQLANGAS